MSTENILSIEKKNKEAGYSLAGGIVGGIAGVFAGPEGIVPGAEAGEEIGGEIGGNMTIADVTFSTHGGGTRTYRYTGTDAEAILAGADPADFSGEWIG